jgi:hypothetical protein
MASPPSSARSVQVSLISYGHANGPVVQQQQVEEARYHRILAYNIRHLPNPPRHLRVKATGLSRRLQKEFLQNDDVEKFLVKVQGEILNAVEEGGDQLSIFTEEQAEYKHGGSGEADQRSAHLSEQPSLEGTEDIDIVVTICCEEGRHRSVAFVAELARRLAVLKDGDDGFSRHWQMTINAMHRDIGDVEGSEQSTLGQNRRPNKVQAKTRQRERREKENMYKSQLGDDE